MKKIVQKNILSILLALIIGALALLCCIARYFPSNVGQVYKVSDPAIEILDSDDIATKVNCTIDDQNNYEITSPDPQIYFSSNSEDAKGLKLNLESSSEAVIPFEVYLALEGEEFSAEKCYAGYIFKGESSAIVSIPSGNYRSIRLDIDGDSGVVFKNLELYNEAPYTVQYTPIPTAKDYVLTVLIPLICAVIAFFANKRLRLCENAIDSIKKNYKTAISFFGLTIAAIPVSAFIEWALSSSDGQSVFNPYKWLFFFGVLEIAIIFVLMRKQLAQKPEKLFLALVLTVGFVMLFGAPVKHICWDLDSHYSWAVHSSFSDMAYLTGADVSIENVLPQSLFNNEFTLESYKNDLAYINSLDGMLTKQVEADFSLAHLPAGIIIAVARMFGASFWARYVLGRITYLLVYAVVCYFAIKKIKSGKMILATICLFPTSIFLATNYAYDGYVTAFTMLGVSYFVSELQEPDKPIALKDTIIMGCAFALGAWSKLVYIVLMGMTLFMRKNWVKKSDKRKYYFIIIAIFVLMFCYFAISTLVQTGEGGDTRGGDVNPIAQIKFILFNPIDYAKILIRFLSSYLSIDGMQGYISNFAYMGHGKWWPVFVVLIGFTALTDANNEVSFKIPAWMKALSVLLFIGMASLIATALFINYTPVNSQTISGCQPRYLIPLLAPLLLLVTGQRKNFMKEKAAYNGFVLLAATSAVMLDIYAAIITKMI